MKFTIDNTDIPDWLKPHIPTMCKCGLGVMIDDGPVGADGIMKLTQRWCSNPECKYHMAEKVQMLAKRFGIDGVGPETARYEVTHYMYRTHLDALRVWFQEKPSVFLYEAAEMSYIYGVDSKWKEWLVGYNSLDEFYRESKNIPDVMLMHRDYLYQCMDYFNIKKSEESRAVLKVMLSGSMHGYSSRDAFLSAINSEFKDYFCVLDNKKTVRDTVALIIEKDSVDYSKSDIAKRHSIPTFTSQEFIAFLNQIKEEMQCLCKNS